MFFQTDLKKFSPPPLPSINHVEGRKILDASLIASDVVDECARRKKNDIVIKLDIEKAFDKAGWDFLDLIL